MDDVIRDALGRFQPGTAPGPGRTIGSRSRLVTALRQALDEDSTLEKLRNVAIEKMEQGDPQFWRMLLDRVWPTKMALSEEQPQVVTFRWVSPNERENDLG